MSNARVRAVILIGLVGCANAGEPTHDMQPVHNNVLARTCGGITVTATAYDGVIRLSYNEPKPSFAVVGKLEADGEATVDTALHTQGKTVSIDDACRVKIVEGDRVIVEDAGTFAVSDAARLTRVVHGDRVYGLGERTGGLDRRGRTWTFWNTDAYDATLGGWKPDQDPLYQSIPFEIRFDGHAHGVFTDETRRMTLELGAARDTYSAFGARSLDQYVIAGPSMPEVVDRYTQLTGRPAVPPQWALGFHQSRWGYPDGATVEAVAARFRSEAIPADGIWLDIQHLRGFRSFTVDDALFPPAMFQRLKQAGWNVVAIADPGIKVDASWDVYQSGVAGDHFLKQNGAIYQGTAWPGASAFPDFSRAETRAWWGELVKQTADRGVAGIWLDVNEPTTFPEGGGGTTIPDDVGNMAELHNVYALLQAQATYEALATKTDKPFVLSRAGYAGIQRYAAVWTGDTPSTWSGLQQTLPMLLGMGMSGIPIVGSDIGGYSGHATPELYARWLALGSISPFSRAHVTNGVPGQEPWMFTSEVTDISRARLADRYRLLPYIVALADEAAKTGAPILRPLVWHFPDDANTYDLADEAMLGPNILVAPVLEQGATTRKIYLPAGRWYELHSDAIYEGPTTIEIGTTLAALPIFAREGAIIPATDGIDVYPDKSTSFATTQLTAESDGARVQTSSATTIRVHRVDATPTVEGAASYNYDPIARMVTATASDLRLHYDKTISDPRPPVAVTFEVHVPTDTPMSAQITVATSANGWLHQPIPWVQPGLARGTVMLPRGEWFEYKFTRGDWLTVEKGSGCTERPNRYRFGAPATQSDTVVTWRDRC